MLKHFKLNKITIFVIKTHFLKLNVIVVVKNKFSSY